MPSEASLQAVDERLWLVVATAIVSRRRLTDKTYQGSTHTKHSTRTAASACAPRRSGCDDGRGRKTPQADIALVETRLKSLIRRRGAIDDER